MTFPNPSTQFQPGQSGNPKGRPKGSGILQRAARILGDAEGLEAEEIAIKLVQRAKKGNLKAISMILDRLDGPLVRKLEIDQRTVVLSVSYFERAAIEVVGKELGARILARTLELAESDGREPGTEGASDRGAAPTSGGDDEPTRALPE